MAGRSFSTHRVNAWTYRHPVAWGAVMGVAFAAVALVTNLALGSQGGASVVAALIGGAVLGILTFLWTCWRRRRFDHPGDARSPS